MLLLTMDVLYGLKVIFILIPAVLGADKVSEDCPELVHERGYFSRVHDGMCYMFVDKEEYWKEASEYCQNMGGDLVTIKNDATMKFIKKNLKSPELNWNNNGVWIGARYYEDSQWIWVTGDKLVYTYWDRNEPSHLLGLFKLENCALMRREYDWRWHDYPCGSIKYHYRFICQFPVAYPFGEKGLSAQMPVNEDSSNGNLSILLIVISLAVLTIIVMFVIFFLYRRRQKRHNAGNVIVRFENCGYGQRNPDETSERGHHEQNGRDSRPVSNVYVNPEELNTVYEEIPRNHGSVTNLRISDSSFPRAPLVEPDELSVSSSCEGAVGGVVDDGPKEEDQARPLIQAAAASAPASQGREIYLDMNCGTKLLPLAENAKLNEKKKLNDSMDSQEKDLDDKSKSVEHTYANTAEVRNAEQHDSSEKLSMKT